MIEFVIVTIHLIEVTKDVIEVLAIDVLPSFSNRSNSHILEIRRNVLREMADSNLVNLLVGIHFGLK